MGHLFWLSDVQWAIIEPYMPKNQPGARCVGDRTVISGIVHVLKVGCSWCDCPKLELFLSFPAGQTEGGKSAMTGPATKTAIS